MPLMAKHGVFINLIVLRHVAANHSKRQFWYGYQPIILYGKTDDYIFNTYAETVESGQRRWGGYATEYKGQMKDTWDDIPRIYSGSISHPEAIIKPGTYKKAHPCQMPLALPARAMRFSTNPRDTVLDPFLGSGTTAVAVEAMRRRCVGIEIDPDYIQLALERLERERGQLNLEIEARPQTEQLELINGLFAS